jgi:mRNA interferase RelE/StbE
MLYVIEFTDEVLEEQLPKIPKTMRKRILDAIKERLSIAPNDYGKPLKRNLKNHRRLRVGDYRVIYRVHEDKILVLIVEIDHRKDVYED